MKKIVLIASVVLISACSSGPQDLPVQQVTVIDANNNALADSRVAKKKLTNQFATWQGVPYRIGGLSPKGVDCSGFVYLTYLNQFGVAIPRTTQYQSTIGSTVPRSQLQTGDLVFFKTGFKSRHVGIYLDDDRFVHASTSKGVMISSLNGYYWKDKYWQARRIEN